jgi:hypothetical protein
MMQEEEFNHHEVHCMPADKENCKNLKLIDLDYTKDLDTHWLQVSLDFLDKMKGSDQPWYLILRLHRAYGRHLWSVDDQAGGERGTREHHRLLGGDNGPECEVPPHGRTPFRGCKGSSWEGGVRSSTFVYWKDMIKPGRLPRGRSVGGSLIGGPDFWAHHSDSKYGDS